MEKNNSVASNKKTLSHLSQQPPVNLEFQDLTYTVPQGRKDSKLILKNISGQFRSGHLSAILGATGAGKSVLLNVLAGYKTIGAKGLVTINGQPRNINEFRKLSRYIMQDNLLQPMLTTQEYMMFAADLKLNRELGKEDKLLVISEIFEMLRLTSAKNTLTDHLSGGERKRLAIALELINNPSVIFLDEPITGLDDVASFQCISLLKSLAEGGRTVICSIHAPSARIFAKFDHTYFVSAGQCMFQGYGQEIIPFLSNIGLTCPLNYNPADFIVEVATGDYGNELLDKMLTAADNGKSTYYCKKSTCTFEDVTLNKPTVSPEVNKIVYEPTTTTERPINSYKHNCSVSYQFKILLGRFWLQNCRDLKYVILKLTIYTMLGLVQGYLYLNTGQDGSKVIINFRIFYGCLIILLYMSLFPVLLYFYKELQLIKREHFNQWYELKAYYFAMMVTTIPIHVLLTVIYVTMIYIISDQPLEFQRMMKFYSICILIAVVSESFGLMVASLFNLLNGLFVGPALAVPMMLVGVYGIGEGGNIPILIKSAMHVNYLRYGIEGLVEAVYGNGRPPLPCPDEEVVCPFRDPKYFVHFLGMGNGIFWVDLVVLVVCFLFLRLISFYLIKQRLRPNKFFTALHAFSRMTKSHFSITG